MLRNGRQTSGGNPPTSPGHSAEYFRSPGSGGAAALYAWRPVLRDQRDDVAKSYVEAAARAIDALHNSGWISGAIDQAVASTVGVGLRLSPRPDHIALGWTEEETEAWSSIVERRWILWSQNPLECDVAGKHSINELTASWFKTWFAYGEAVSLLPAVKRSVSKSRLKVQLLPPHYLVQDTDRTIRLFQGVRTDDLGLPLAYRFRKEAGLYPETVEIGARDGRGRPQVVHIYHGAPGQTRGITPLAPVLRVIRQFDQLADATLTAALVQAIFAATIESDAPTEELLRGLQDPSEQDPGASMMNDFLGYKAAWHEQSKIDLGIGGRITHLFAGESLKFNRSEHPNDTYEAFSKFLLREISRCLGMTFETLTGDYTGATYSSVRMATAEIWPVILSRREHICARFLQQVYEAWLEEEIESGSIQFPGGINGYFANRLAAVSAEWRGPAKPQADDLKSAKAHEVYKRMGITTDEAICADLGMDWEDVYTQRAREATRRKELGLPDGDTMAPDPVGDALLMEDNPE